MSAQVTAASLLQDQLDQPEVVEQPRSQAAEKDVVNDARQATVASRSCRFANPTLAQAGSRAKLRSQEHRGHLGQTQPQSASARYWTEHSPQVRMTFMRIPPPLTLVTATRSVQRLTPTPPEQ